MGPPLTQKEKKKGKIFWDNFPGFFTWKVGAINGIIHPTDMWVGRDPLWLPILWGHQVDAMKRGNFGQCKSDQNTNFKIIFERKEKHILA